MRFLVRVSVWALLMLAGPLSAQDLAPDVRQQIEQLGSKAMSEALKVIQDRGAIYPFGMLMDKEQEVRLVGYSGNDNAKPPAEEYVGALVQQVRDTTAVMLSVEVAAVLRMHSIRNEDGKSVPGVWMLIDHRHGTPLIIFQPLIPGDKPNHYSLGPQLFEASSQPLFNH